MHPLAAAHVLTRLAFAPPVSHCLQGLKELKELISSYQSMRDSGRAVAICQTIIETARQCNLDKVRGCCCFCFCFAGSGEVEWGCRAPVCWAGTRAAGSAPLPTLLHALPRLHHNLPSRSTHHPNHCRCAPQDVKLPEDDQAVKDMSVDERDGIVGGVYRKLMEIEVRLWPAAVIWGEASIWL